MFESNEELAFCAASTAWILNAEPPTVTVSVNTLPFAPLPSPYLIDHVSPDNRVAEVDEDGV